MPKTIDLNYVPTEKQKLLHSTAARQIFYGGAAGGAKSHGLRWDFYGACLENPGLDAYLFRRTLKQLENTHIKRVHSEIPESLGRFVEKKNRVEWNNGSYLNFCYAEKDADVYNYDSVEFHALGIDEAQHFDPAWLSYLRTRCRIGSFKPRQNIFPRLIMTANPGGLSHHWLKKKYIDQAPPMTVFNDKSMVSKITGESWTTIFIPSKMIDNPHLDDGYDAAFGDLPEWKQAMLVDGDWDMVPGAYFDCFTRIHNVLPQFFIPPHLTRFMAMDKGFAKPFSIGWYVVMDGETWAGNVLLPPGAIVRYREWYGCKLDKEGEPTNQGLRLSPGEIAKGIKEREDGEEILYRIAPSDAWEADTGISVAEGLARNGVYCQKADRRRIPGWERMYEMLDGSSEERGFRIPTLYVTENCVEWIRTVPAVMASEKDPDDVEKVGEDHPADETRYACMSRPITQKQPEKKRDMLAPPTFNEMIDDYESRLSGTPLRRHRW